ncbi:spike base protein, RCAP_Rcc01079 family [Paracoccus aminophilus]|uniref:Uncharacterized protein n=1 Tax=Paracoccus aminophilus JCM 7686 TaxID=1367847 RepID=S5YVK3_PARAH|nr:hypothetical protein [Paracoccus aminophilus]AGT09261.1 hypothetical protein JCM7686_2182 [Paracoccus aminophilus JCM 7686]
MPIKDRFEGYADSLASPYVEDAFAIMPSDSSDLAQVTKGLNVNTGGTIRVRMKSGADVTLTVPDACILPFRISRVFATGTTATGIVGLA